MPCTALNTSNTGKLGARPQSSELTVKIASEIMKYRLRPITSANHPLIGNTIAFAARYEVSTQVASSKLAPTSPAM
jgi:hypothetical protein